jgi:hypothetical protein
MPAVSPDRKKYLQAFFKQRWATVKMKLFDPKTAHEVDLLEIYSPLPVDFAITLELNKQEGFQDWWCARGEKDHGGREDLEPWEQAVVERTDRRALTEAIQEHRARSRAWTDLQANESALQPLVDIAHGWARQQKTNRPRDADIVRWRAEAEHAALVQRRFVLVGDPGSGKSTFLRHLALSWTAQLLRETGETRAPTGARLDVETG